jgi:hypothetical protein
MFLSNSLNVANIQWVNVSMEAAEGRNNAWNGNKHKNVDDTIPLTV